MTPITYICFFVAFVQIPFCLSVYLNDNGEYEDLIIKIDPHVKNLTFLGKTHVTMKTFSALMLAKTNFSIKEIKVILPPVFDEREIPPGIKVEVLEDESISERASILIGPESPLHGNSPFTLHMSGCGQPGQYIYLTPEIFSSVTSSFGNTGLVLLHEWGHYRWGLFDEYGETGNNNSSPFYFTDGKKIKPTGCPEELKGWLLTPNLQPCQRGLDLLPELGCQFYVYYNSSDYTTPSLLMGYGQNIKKEKFCGSTELKHNHRAPSVHNLKCNYKSAWQVLSSHQDFDKLLSRKSRRSISFSPPEIKYYKRFFSEAKKQLFILVDLYRFGSVLSNRVKQALHLLKQQEILSNFNVNYTFQNTGQNSQNSLLNTIQEQIRKFSDPKQVSFWIVMEPVNSQEMPPKEVPANFPKINFLIPYGKNLPTARRTLMEKSRGVLKTFPEKLTASEIADSLVESVLKRVLPDEDIPAQVYKEKFVKGTMRGSFLLDSNCGKAIFTAREENSTERSYLSGKLIAPEGEICSTRSSAARRGDQLSNKSLCRNLERYSVLSFEISEDPATRGRWEYSIEREPINIYDAVSVNVFCRLQNSTLRILPRVFTRDSADVFNASLLENNHVLLSVSVMLGISPVLDARVSATVVSEVGIEMHEHRIWLYDDGIGPDISKDDGIYCNVFTDFRGNGFYSFSFFVSTNETSEVLVHHGLLKKSSKDNREYIIKRIGHGTNMPNPVRILRDEIDIVKLRHRIGEPKSEFSYDDDLSDHKTSRDSYDLLHETAHIEAQERSTQSYFIEVVDFHENLGDNSRPEQVTDLKIIELSYRFSTVTLEWTSVGDDGMSGKADSILLKYSSDGSVFPSRFHTNGTSVERSQLKRNTSLTPLEARQKHRVVVKVPKGKNPYPEDLLYFFALVYLDEVGNLGPVSNAAIAFFKPEKYSDELQTLKRHSLSGMMIILIFFFFLGCVVTFIIAVRFYHRYRRSVVVNTKA